MMTLRLVARLLFSGALASCMVPAPATRATDAARELNLAARFGRMDIAVGHTSEPARPAFIKRRRSWGHELRIVDVELTGFSMVDADDANVQVDYHWVRMDEGTLRVTRIAQKWANRGKGWQLVSEQRLAGDVGLFGDLPPRTKAPRPDAHFPSKTIR